MIVFWVFAFALIIQLFFFLFYFLRLVFYKRPAVLADDELPAVSIVICARNEDDNLVEFLPSVLAQEYPEFEVVVVNDCSFDNTGDVLKEFASRHPNLKIVTIKEDEYYSHGKKFALTVGIKGAKYDHLLLTDADCRPAGPHWLKHMTQQFVKGNELVLGYGAFLRTKGLLNKIIRFDAFFIGLQYFSYALARYPYMGVGRNLAYTKEVYYRNKGFKSHYHIPSGDDDLFVNQAANSKNTRIEISPESFTHSKAKKTLKTWWRQKRRHLTTGNRYRGGHKFLLGLYVLSQWLFFGCFTALMIYWFQPWIVLGILVLRMMLQFLVFNNTMRKLGEKDLLVYSPLFELFLMFFYLATGIARIFQRRNKRWK
ncbi:MAG: glycosyl transferase family protein [Bacteroidetes bacterium]|nr:MAG: glycosyl transferase family protein [Bacteroidota bacterium]